MKTFLRFLAKKPRHKPQYKAIWSVNISQEHNTRPENKCFNLEISKLGCGKSAKLIRNTCQAQQIFLLAEHINIYC